MEAGARTRACGGLQEPPLPVAAPANTLAVENTGIPGESVGENPQRSPEAIARHYLRQVGREHHPSAAAAPVSALGQVASDFAAAYTFVQAELDRLGAEREADREVLRSVLMAARREERISLTLMKAIEWRLR